MTIRFWHHRENQRWSHAGQISAIPRRHSAQRRSGSCVTRSGVSPAGPDSRYSGRERRRGFRRHGGGIRGRLADAPLARRRERPAGRAPCSRRCRQCDMEGPAVVRRSRDPHLGSCRLMDPPPLNALGRGVGRRRPQHRPDGVLTGRGISLRGRDAEVPKPLLRDRQVGNSGRLRRV